MQMVRWVATSDDNYDATSGVIRAGPDGEATPADPQIWGPVAYVGPDDPVPAAIGCLTSIDIHASSGLAAYQVFAVSTPSTEAPDPDEDWAGFLAWVNAHPVPSGWGLTFSNFVGVLDEDGDSNLASVSAPSGTGLLGEQFYIIVVVDLEDCGELLRVRSVDRLVTFVDAGE